MASCLLHEFNIFYFFSWASLVAQTVKNASAMEKMLGSNPGLGRPHGEKILVFLKFSFFSSCIASFIWDSVSLQWMVVSFCVFWFYLRQCLSTVDGGVFMCVLVFLLEVDIFLKCLLISDWPKGEAVNWCVCQVSSNIEGSPDL